MFNWFKRKRVVAEGPDFSGIDSQQKALDAFSSGDLEQLHLVPHHFGGSDCSENTVFVPVGISDVKAGIDANIIEPLVASGKVTSYQASPEYQGRSFVPIAINIVASNPGQFSTTINIWGEALRRT